MIGECPVADEGKGGLPHRGSSKIKLKLPGNGSMREEGLRKVIASDQWPDCRSPVIKNSHCLVLELNVAAVNVGRDLHS